MGRKYNATIDMTGLQHLQEKLDNYGTEAQAEMLKYLSREALDQVGPAITRLLPVSGRTFMGHPLGAKAGGV